jgi:hypothetical protein
MEIIVHTTEPISGEKVEPEFADEGGVEVHPVGSRGRSPREFRLAKPVPVASWLVEVGRVLDGKSLNRFVIVCVRVCLCVGVGGFQYLPFFPFGTSNFAFFYMTHH